MAGWLRETILLKSRSSLSSSSQQAQILGNLRNYTVPYLTPTSHPIIVHRRYYSEQRQKPVQLAGHLAELASYSGNAMKYTVTNLPLFVALAFLVSVQRFSSLVYPLEGVVDWG